MAAYAALVSLMHIINQIEQHHRPPISVYKTQVESLTENVTFLQEFLEGHSPVSSYSKLEAADGLESRIADAAYAAEDVIESHIVDRIIPAASTTHGDQKIRYLNCFGGLQKAISRHGKKLRSSSDFYQGLQKVILDMDLIKKEVMEIKEKMGDQDQLQRKSTPSSTGQNCIIVGLDDVLYGVVDKLTRQESCRRIIPIVGMGGIGKTTLARKIYQNQLVLQHFDILAWVTISREYRMREILLQLLQEGGGDLSQMNEYQLGDQLHKRLINRRYLIIMDDIWDIEVWDQLKLFFPDNNNGSRIMLTTRLSNLASQVTDFRGIDMAFLDENNSWDLFSKTVFGEEGCPLELEKIGKKIVKNCKGLPLSIVVIGGLLAKSKHTREYWEYIAKNLNSVVNSEEDERYLKILHMSYNQLPVYLKPCFLYMGVFSEDSVICVSMLSKLWVAEGFLKPMSDKHLETVAKEYLKELIDRNLILVHKFGSIGGIKYCKIHDLVRDLCLREARKERFYDITMKDTNSQRRIVIPKSSTSPKKDFGALKSTPLARSLICHVKGVLPLFNFRLLRILRGSDESFYLGDRHVLEDILSLVNSRYLDVKVHPYSEFPSSVCLLWNLHTIIVDGYWGSAPVEIWNMPQLRHVKFDALYLPDIPGSVHRRDDIFLENLQTLELVKNFRWGEEVIKKIPNIKKLGIQYTLFEGSSSMYHLHNLEHLHKLESFTCYYSPDAKPSEIDFLQNLAFPHSLKKLNFGATNVHWQDILGKIGSLPLLEKLRLYGVSFEGGEWETVEGNFPSLKFLHIESTNLEWWTTESSHFPCLKHLHLRFLEELKEIPSDIGDIPTLQSIELRYCSDSAVISAKKILEEQEEIHGELVALQVRVRISEKNEALESLASPNFQVHY